MSDKNGSKLDRRSLLLAGTTLAAASTLGPLARSPARAQTSSLNPQPIPPSPEWALALPTGPDTSVKITEAYAAMIARDAYFWAWPLVNIYNKRLNFKDVPEPMMVGPGPAAPLNRVAMLTDYIDPGQRLVACPNQPECDPVDHYVSARGIRRANEKHRLEQDQKSPGRGSR